MNKRFGIKKLLAMLIALAQLLCAMPALADAPEAGGEGEIQIFVRPEGAGTATFDPEHSWFQATPAPGYAFVEWRCLESDDPLPVPDVIPEDYGGVVSTEPEIEEDDPGVYIALFRQCDPHALSVEPAQHGTLTLEVEGGYDPDAIPETANCALVAAPDEGYKLCCVFVSFVDEYGEAQKVTLPSTQFSNDRYEFSMPATDTSFRALFIPEDSDGTVAIRFHANGGWGRMSRQAAQIGEIYWLDDCGFIREGYRFSGWNTDPLGGGMPVEDRGSILVEENADIDLYAQWEAYSAWRDLQAMLDAQDYVSMDSDVVAQPGDTGLVIPEGHEVSLNMNGYMLDGSALEDAVIHVEEGAQLHLNLGTGRLSGMRRGILNEGTLELSGGGLRGNALEGPALDNRGTVSIFDFSFAECAEAAVVNGENATIEANGIRIVDGAADALVNHGEVTCNGTITGNGGAGAVNDGRMRLEGSIVSGNGCGAINTGEMTVSGSMIRGNGGAEVGGVDNAGTLKLYASSVVENTGTSVGGVRNTGDFTVETGEIMDNVGSVAGGLSNAGTALLRDCFIEGNSASDAGTGGAYMGEDAELTIDGTVSISDNVRDGETSNLFMPAGRTLRYVESSAWLEVNIGVTSGDPQAQPVLTEGLFAVDMRGALFSDDADYCIYLNDDDELAIGPKGDSDCTVTYRVDGEVYSVVSVANEYCAPILRPEKDGWTFQGWADEAGLCYTEPFDVYEDMTVDAVWEEKERSAWERLAAKMREGGTVRLSGSVYPTGSEPQYLMAASPKANRGSAIGNDAPPDPLVVPSGVHTTLDLNGYSIQAEDALSDALIIVEEGAELTLTDSRGGGSIYYRNGAAVVRVAGQFNQQAGILSCQGGRAGVIVEAGGRYVLSGGGVSYCEQTELGGVYNAGEFILSGGTIGWNGLSGMGGGVSNVGSFTMTGGCIRENGGRTAGAVDNRGSFTMNGGSIWINQGVGAHSAGGVANAGEMTLSGGIVWKNNGSCAGGVLNRGTLTLTGGEVSVNDSDGMAGGIVNEAGGSFSMSGGRVVENYGASAYSAGGVCLLDGAIRLSGNPVISSNFTPRYSSDLYLPAGAAVDIDGALTDGLSVGFAVEDPSSLPALTRGLEGNGGVGGFFSDDEGYAVGLADGEAALVAGEHSVTFLLQGGVMFVQSVPDQGYAVPVDMNSPTLEIAYWYEEDESVPFDFGTPITGDLTLNAMAYTLVQVTFDPVGGGGSMEPVRVRQDEDYVLPECGFTPPAGMTFLSWNCYGESYAPGESVQLSGDTDIWAEWAFVTYDITVDDAIPHGRISADPETFTLASGWISFRVYPDPGYEVESVTLTCGGETETLTQFNDYGDYSECGCWPWTAGEMFVTASFRLIPTEYVVTFDPGLGEGIRTEYVWAGETVVPPEEAPECRGVRFLGWSPDGEILYDFDTPVTGDMTLTGLWEDLPSGTVSLGAAEHGGMTVAAKYDLYGEAQSVDIAPDADPVYEGETVVLTAVPDSGYALDTLSVTGAGGEVPLAAGEAEGTWTFTMPGGDVSVTMGFIAVGDYVVTTVSEGDGAGHVSAKARADAGETVPFEVRTEEGYWLESLRIIYYQGEDRIDESVMGQSSFVMPEADVTLVARFSDYQVSVAASEHGAVTPSAGHARAGATVALTIEPEEGYRLDTLTVTDAAGDEVPVTDGSFAMPASDVEISATFRLIGQWFVTFETGTEDVIVDPQSVMQGEYAREPQGIDRTGWLLLGWCVDGTEDYFHFEDTQISGDITLVAQWERLCVVRIDAYGNAYYQHDYGTQYVRKGDCAVEPEYEILEGFTMEGWFVGHERFDFSTPIQEDLHIAISYARNISTWAEFKNAVETEEIYKFIMVNDITRPANQTTISPRTSYSVTLNLNGHKLDLNGMTTHAFYVGNATFFYLKDTVGEGRITGGRGPVIAVGYNGRATMYSGIISGNAVSGNVPGVINVGSGGYFSMYGGVIENNTGYTGGGVYAEGNLNIEGGRISNNTASSSGGGVYMAENSHLNFISGEVSGNTSGGSGGGIWMDRYSYSRMYDGLITRNTARSGGGVYVCPGTSSKEVFQMFGGSITGNTAETQGGGVYASNQGLLIHSSPVIIGNTLTDGSDDDVFIKQTSSPAVKIRTPYALEEGALVGVSVDSAPTVQQPITITTGLLGRDVTAYLVSNNPEYLVDMSDEGEAILRLDTVTVSFDSAGGSDVAPRKTVRGDTVAAPEDPERTGWLFAGWFEEGAQAPFDFENTAIQEDITLTAHWTEAYTVTFVTGVDELTVPPQTVAIGEPAAAPEGVERTGWLLLGWAADGAEELYDFTAPVTGDITLTARWEKLMAVSFTGGYVAVETQYVRKGACASPVSLEREGYTLQGWYLGDDLFDFSTPVVKDIELHAGWAKNVSSWDELVSAMGNSGRIILMEHITRTEGAEPVDLALGVSLEINLNGHTLDLNGSTDSVIYINNGRMLALTDLAGGGCITGARAPVLCVYGGGAALLKGATLSGNNISGNGVINVVNGGHFSMLSGAIVDNTVSGKGGALYLKTGAITVKDGVIANNSASSGGGIYVELGTLDIMGGEIANNTARSGFGGGVSIGMAVDGLMTGGVIRGNTALKGGGVFVATGSTTTYNFKMTGGRITGNTAESAAGVYACSEAMALRENPVITGNFDTAGNASNLWLERSTGVHSTSVRIIADLGDDARIGVTCEQAPELLKPVKFTSGLSGRGGLRHFASDLPDYQLMIDAESGEAELFLPTPAFGEPDLILPGSVEAVEESAFEGIGASVVYVPDGCASIGKWAFRNSAVTQIRLPADCAVGEDAFDGCTRVLIYGTAGSPAQQYAEDHVNCLFIEE